MSSSIGFFLGMTNAVRPRCNAPKILLKVCKTSSDDLRMNVVNKQWRKKIIWMNKLNTQSGDKVIAMKSHLKWYELSTSSMWCMACCKWLAASCTCWSFHGESWLMDVRWTVFCALCTLKLMSCNHFQTENQSKSTTKKCAMKWDEKKKLFGILYAIEFTLNGIEYSQHVIYYHRSTLQHTSNYLVERSIWICPVCVHRCHTMALESDVHIPRIETLSNRRIIWMVITMRNTVNDLNQYDSTYHKKCVEILENWVY